MLGVKVGHDVLSLSDNTFKEMVQCAVREGMPIYIDIKNIGSIFTDDDFNYMIDTILGCTKGTEYEPSEMITWISFDDDCLKNISDKTGWPDRLGYLQGSLCQDDMSNIANILDYLSNDGQNEVFLDIETSILEEYESQINDLQNNGYGIEVWSSNKDWNGELPIDIEVCGKTMDKLPQAQRKNVDSNFNATLENKQDVQRAKN